MARPTTDDLTGDHPLAKVAREAWLTVKNVHLRSQTVERLWREIENSNFSFFDLLLLEQLQALERYLWPGYTDNASNQHVLLLALLANVKRKEQLPVWPIFASQPDGFSDLFSRITSLTLDTSLSTSLRGHLILFIISAFQSLDQGIVRKECAPLVSIAMWHNIHSDNRRNTLLAQSQQLQKAWRASGKKYEEAEASIQARLRFERSWLHTLIQHFLDKLYRTDETSPEQKQEDLIYCELFFELLCDVQSQLPTRRYVNTLLKDLNLLPAIALSPVYQLEPSIQAAYKLLRHYTAFPIDDHTGRQLSRQDYENAQNLALSRLQRTALKLQPQKLNILILANFAMLSQRDEVQGHLENLTYTELLDVCRDMGLRTTEYPENSRLIQDRTFLLESLHDTVGRTTLYTDEMRIVPILPTEASLYDESMVRTDEYVEMRPLAIPKLNLQYLTLGDFLWRAFTLCRLEAFYEIRKYVEEVVKRLQPRSAGESVRFDGFSRMAIPIPRPAIVETTPPRVGENSPAEIKGEVILDVSRLQPGLRCEWEQLKTGDVVYLIALHTESASSTMTNGHSTNTVAQHIGVRALRCAEVTNVLDENGRLLRQPSNAQENGDGFSRPRQRRLLLSLDSAAYKADKERQDAGKGDVYSSINLIVRRKARENNFKAVLESIKQLALTDMPMPSWLLEVFLGYGDPSSATYKRLSNRLKSIDYRDTFLDWQHLIHSLSGRTLEPDPAQDASFAPPYVLESAGVSALPAPKKGKKRRHDQPDGPEPAQLPETVKVSTYSTPNTGPYLTDAPRLNKIRFTPVQIEAVASGTQPGLTLIVGPPGTGKTDVATQIISNIYHNFPQQRTLLVAHSNQALNQLFQKIVALDIDERHLLRLGHGEEDLATTSNFSKAGRVDSFLDRRGKHLAEVQRLAHSVNAPGAHGDSCETADYFDQVYIKPRWRQYTDILQDSTTTAANIIEAFPFHTFFADAPQPLFPPSAPLEKLKEIAKGCERHMRRMFDDLADIRPFELLRAQRDKANYLLIKEARIIAMTVTHATMRRQEIAGLGFRYDNVIMEEAAQVTEIESFIPFVMQSRSTFPHDHSSNPGNDSNKIRQYREIQRIVLVGDHLQNTPVIQHPAAKSFSHLDQSLFQRLIRLGAPHVVLDAQGRARPQLAELYQWRYPRLVNLPNVTNEQVYLLANAGFKHTAQWIEVADYKGKGETSSAPHVYQNLGEAEYVVATYMYMRLLGYPASSICILVMYAGQAALIKDVLARRCKGQALFDLPRWTGTVDKFQGEQSDYVLLSLVRTNGIGYMRDLRRLTVALSRARLGLYVFGRRTVFEGGMETREAFEKLWMKNGNGNLEIVTGEMHPTYRAADSSDGADSHAITELHGVEHLGQYVFEMTRAKLQQLQQGGQLIASQNATRTIGSVGSEEEEDNDLEQGDVREGYLDDAE